MSIISIPAGIQPPAIISATQLPASSIVGKPTKAALTTSGVFKIFTVTSVMTPNKPSEPVIKPKKSYPSASIALPPNLVIVPSIKTTSMPNKLFVVAPYFNECTPPEFSATLPPMEHAIWLDGSGA